MYVTKGSAISPSPRNSAGPLSSAFPPTAFAGRAVRVWAACRAQETVLGVTSQDLRSTAFEQRMRLNNSTLVRLLVCPLQVFTVLFTFSLLTYTYS